MKLTKSVKQSKAIKLEIKDGKKQLGRAYLYLIYNGLHKRPYGLLEDLFVAESQRGKGLGSRLVLEAIKEAKKRKCYKIIGTSRFSNLAAHRLYTKLGLKKHGAEFRLDM